MCVCVCVGGGGGGEVIEVFLKFMMHICQTVQTRCNDKNK